MRFLKIDLHVHTNRSDSSSSMEEVLDAARRRGLDGVAITDHDTVQGLTTTSKLASDLLVIPGIEANTRDGHLLILGIRDSPPRNLDAVAVSNFARRGGGVVIVPHPGIPFLSIREDVIKRIRPDAIETYNAELPFKRIRGKNVELAERLGLPQTGGSDAHTCKTVGDMYTVVEAEEKSVGAVLDAVRKGRVQPVGEISAWPERAVLVLRMMFSVSTFWRKRNNR